MCVVTRLLCECVEGFGVGDGLWCVVECRGTGPPILELGRGGGCDVSITRGLVAVIV